MNTEQLKKISDEPDRAGLGSDPLPSESPDEKAARHERGFRAHVEALASDKRPSMRKRRVELALDQFVAALRTGAASTTTQSIAAHLIDQAPKAFGALFGVRFDGARDGADDDAAAVSFYMLAKTNGLTEAQARSFAYAAYFASNPRGKGRTYEKDVPDLGAAGMATVLEVLGKHGCLSQGVEPPEV